MTLFEAIADRVTAKEVAELYGMGFGRNRRALCPWHNDTHPDLAFYDRHCYCHACHNGGDAVALTAQLFNLTMLEAAAKLNADFELGLDVRNTAPPPGPSQAQIRKQERERGTRIWSTLCDVIHEADERLLVLDKQGPAAWDDPAFVKTLEARCRAETTLHMMWAEGR